MLGGHSTTNTVVLGEGIPKYQIPPHTSATIATRAATSDPHSPAAEGAEEETLLSFAVIASNMQRSRGSLRVRPSSAASRAQAPPRDRPRHAYKWHMAMTRATAAPLLYLSIRHYPLASGRENKGFSTVYLVVRGCILIFRRFLKIIAILVRKCLHLPNLGLVLVASRGYKCGTCIHTKFSTC